MFNWFKKNEKTIIKEGTLDLFIESYSFGSVQLQIRGLTESEQVQFEHTTNSDRSQKTEAYRISSMPISLTINHVGAGLNRGVCYVRLFLRSEGVKIALLCAGYVTSNSTPNWPNGIIEDSLSGNGFRRRIESAGVGAAAEQTQLVPTGAVWRIHSIEYTLTTGVDVADRLPKLTFQNGDGTFFRIPSNSVLLTSSQRDFKCFEGAQSPVLINTTQYFPILPDFKFGEEWRVQTETDNLTGDDQYSTLILMIEEWLEA